MKNKTTPTMAQSRIPKHTKREKPSIAWAITRTNNTTMGMSKEVECCECSTLWYCELFSKSYNYHFGNGHITTTLLRLRQPLLLRLLFLRMLLPPSLPLLLLIIATTAIATTTILLQLSLQVSVLLLLLLMLLATSRNSITTSVASGNIWQTYA